MDKPWQVVGVGLTILVLYVALIANPAIAYAVASLVLFSLFTAGFFFQPESEHFVVPFVPGKELAAPDGDVIIEESVPAIFEGRELDETYPQHFFFHVELRRLWLLAATALVPLAVLIWLWGFRRVPSVGGFPPMELTVLPLYLFGGVWLVMRKWLHERRLLSSALVGWAPFYRDGQNLIYQFFDSNGEEAECTATGPGAYVLQITSL